MTSVVLVDHRDSFTHNVGHALVEHGARCTIVHADSIDLAALVALSPDGVVLGPGPCTPAEAGVSRAVAESALAGAWRVPLLGICLGHQVVGTVAGGRLGRARRALHGTSAPIDHDGAGIFRGLPSPLSVARYNSLILDEASLPPSLHVSARDDLGEVMALRHRSWPIETVQFHPESWIDGGARAIFARWLEALAP